METSHENHKIDQIIINYVGIWTNGFKKKNPKLATKDSSPTFFCYLLSICIIIFVV